MLLEIELVKVFIETVCFLGTDRVMDHDKNYFKYEKGLASVRGYKSRLKKISNSETIPSCSGFNVLTSQLCAATQKGYWNLNSLINPFTR